MSNFGRESRSIRVMAICLVGIFALGCVSAELRSMTTARADYEACLAEHGERHPDCRALRAVLLTEEQRYEDNARRAWVCDPITAECPSRH